MYCTKCGTKLSGAARACSACGQFVAGQPGVNPSVPPSYGYSQQLPSPPQYAYVPPQPSPYADFWPRVGAYLIDRLILSIATVVYALLAFFWLGLDYFHELAEELGKDEPVFPTALLVTILLWWMATVVTGWLYHALSESGPRQGTIGKNILGIIVTDLQGQHISFARASGRFFARIIAGMLPLALGFIMAAFTEKRQALHDMIAGCLVMKKP